METILNAQSYHGPVVDDLRLIAEFELEEAEQDSCEDLHLSVSKFFPQTYPGSSLSTQENHYRFLLMLKNLFGF